MWHQLNGECAWWGLKPRTAGLKLSLLNKKEVNHMKNSFVPLLCGLVAIILLLPHASFGQSGARAGCSSSAFPSYTYSQRNLFPGDGSLRRPEDGRALADGSVIVGDEEFGLRLIESSGKSRAFGKFKQAGWQHNPPASPAGPNGIFLERDGRHVLLTNVYTGQIYRVDIKTQDTKLIYDHEFGINSLVRDSRGGIWFTQSARNTNAAEMWQAVDRPVASGAVFYLAGSGNEVVGRAIEVARDIYFANGIALDKAEKYLYVSETMMNRVLRFEVTASHSLQNRETYQHVITPDNLEIDRAGNLWIASPISNKVFAVDRKCGSLHTVFSAPSAANSRRVGEWIENGVVGKPLLPVMQPDLWEPLPGIVTGMFWSRDHKTFYITGLGNSILRFN
jgi:sugar lactone lactonase YvrE